MSREQIIEHLAAGKGKKLCGTFRPSQLEPTTRKKSPGSLRFLAALLLVFGMSLFSCQTDQPVQKPADEERTLGMILPSSPEDPVPDTLIRFKESGVIQDEEVLTIETVSGGIESDEFPGIAPVDSTVPPGLPEEVILGMISEPMPEYPGGESKLREYISNNIHYPDSAKANGTGGTVYVRFTVCSDGTVNNAKVLRGLGHGLDEEALRVIREMPRWKPGTRNGVPADVEMVLPIKFRTE